MFHFGRRTTGCTTSGTTVLGYWCCLTLAGLLLLQPPLLVTATISIVDTGRTFDSKPDRSVGQKLYQGYQYMGRLQILRENESLCPQQQQVSSSTSSSLTNNKPYHITPPEDNIPVALIVSGGGGCSVAEKAVVATTMIEPPGVVQYLIIKDHSKRLTTKGLNGINQVDEDDLDDVGDDDDDDDDEEEEDVDMLEFEEEIVALSSDDESVSFQFSLNHTNNEEKALHIPTGLFVLDTVDDETYFGRFPKSLNQQQQPPVAILHVSTRVGNLLVKIVESESNLVRQSGGTKFLCNGEGPNGGKMLFTWMLAVLFMCACGCCCMLMAVQTAWEDEQQQQQTTTPPVRRRLTLQQVRTRFPAFHFNPAEQQQHQQQQHDVTTIDPTHQYCQLLDECTICLDEFHAGDRCRKLPCQHVFHSTCIARWLIERSAVCPLCKMDLFEDEEVPDDDEGEEQQQLIQQHNSVPNLPEESEPLFSRQWWTTLTNNPRRRPAVASSGAQMEVPPQPRRQDIFTPVEPGSTHHDPLVSRTWWPFSVEVAPSPVEEESGRSSSIRPTMRPSRRNRWNLFGRRRTPEVSPRDALVTELTEPLISEEATATQSQQQQQQQQHPFLQPQQSLEEITFSRTTTFSDDVTTNNEVHTGRDQPATTVTDIV